MDFKVLKWFGVILITATGIIHFIEAPEYFNEAGYLGTLFILNGLGSLLTAYGIYKKEWLGWAVGFLIALGSIIGYGISRTSGLPGSGIKEWFDFMGILSLAAEGLFILTTCIYIAEWMETPKETKPRNIK